MSYPWDKNRNPLAISAGQLRNQVTIQSQSTTQDASGGPVPTAWNTLLTTWAAIATTSQREVYQSGQSSQFTAQVTHKVTIRWPGSSISIAGGMQVLFGARTFSVQTVENVQERNRILNLMCVEINGAS